MLAFQSLRGPKRFGHRHLSKKKSLQGHQVAGSKLSYRAISLLQIIQTPLQIHAPILCPYERADNRNKLYNSIKPNLKEASHITKNGFLVHT